nr:hypothetical protein [Tanacetum cinerariifolium]
STPRAHRTPTLTDASPQGKKRKQSAEEISDDRERDEMAKATLLSLTLYKTSLAAEAQENIAKVQEKLDEEEIEKMVEGEEDEESYASEFADSMFNDVDDFGTRIEPRSHKENPEGVDDDDVTKMKNDKKDEDEVKDDDIEKTDDAAEEKDNDDHTDHTLVETHATVNEDREIAPTNIPELISKEFATHGPKIIEELFQKHMQNTTLNLYPTTSSSTANLQQWLYSNMKSKPQDQAAVLEL